MIKKIIKFIFPSLDDKDKYLKTIAYLRNQRDQLFGQINILMETEWDFVAPSLSDIIQVLLLYGAHMSDGKITLNTSPLSILYPIFADMPEQKHFIELDLATKELSVDGSVVKIFEDDFDDKFSKKSGFKFH